MKVNKITSLVCFSFIFVSGMMMVLLYDNNVIFSVLSGLFTGFIASFVISIIGYFHEKAKIIESIGINIKSLFVNMTAMSKILGNTLPSIHNSEIIQDLSFKHVSGISTLNLNLLEKMNLGLYNPFVKNSKNMAVCKKLLEYWLSLQTISNISKNIETRVLEYNLEIMNVQLAQTKGITVPSEKLKQLDELKNEINIKVAKFHEYVCGQTIELEKISRKYYNGKKNDKNWLKIKEKLLLQVDDILRG